MVTELNNVLHSGYYSYPLEYDNVDWFLDELVKLEKNMRFYFEKTR